jgi:type IV secretory pathway protease TraF
VSDTRRRAQSRRLRRAARILFTAAAITACLSLAGRQLAARLTINVTTSMPRGLYWLRLGGRVARHSTVTLAIPSGVRQLVVSNAATCLLASGSSRVSSRSPAMSCASSTSATA